ncbi:hypothetical protein PFISCL1PPCAC_17351, partial [Pristionchus fissidentatus]
AGAGPQLSAWYRTSIVIGSRVFFVDSHASKPVFAVLETKPSLLDHAARAIRSSAISQEHIVETLPANLSALFHDRGEDGSIYSDEEQGMREE